MILPAEAIYKFPNPRDDQHNYVNSKVSIEVFFGDNGWEGRDISLGRIEIEKMFPAISSSDEIQLVMTLDKDQLLCIKLLDPCILKYCSIAYISLSGINPPKIVKGNNADLTEDAGTIIQKQINELINNRVPRVKRRPHNGNDLSQDINVSFLEAFNGGDKTVEIISTETCSVCSGSGIAPGRSTKHCADCQVPGGKKQ